MNCCRVFIQRFSILTTGLFCFRFFYTYYFYVDFLNLFIVIMLKELIIIIITIIIIIITTTTIIITNFIIFLFSIPASAPQNAVKLPNRVFNREQVFNSEAPN